MYTQHAHYNRGSNSRREGEEVALEGRKQTETEMTYCTVCDCVFPQILKRAKGDTNQKPNLILSHVQYRPIHVHVIRTAGTAAACTMSNCTCTGYNLLI